MRLEPGAQPAGAGRHDHVVDGGAQRVLDALHELERRRPVGEAAVGGDGGVERRARGAAGGQRADRLALGRPLAADVEHRAERPAQAVAHLVGGGHDHRVAGGAAELADGAGGQHHGPTGLAHQVGGGPGEHLAVGGQRLRPPLVLRRLDLVALGVAVEHQHEQLGPGGAVDGGVVHLGEDGEAVVGQALDDVALPQRPAPVERTADDAGHELGDLLVAPGRRHRGVAHVEVEVEVGVVDPVRVVEVERARCAGAGAAARGGAGAARSGGATTTAARSRGRRAARRSRGSRRGRTATPSPCRGTMRPTRRAASRCQLSHPGGRLLRSAGSGRSRRDRRPCSAPRRVRRPAAACAGRCTCRPAASTATRRWRRGAGWPGR